MGVVSLGTGFGESDVDKPLDVASTSGEVMVAPMTSAASAAGDCALAAAFGIAGRQEDLLGVSVEAGDELSEGVAEREGTSGVSGGFLPAAKRAASEDNGESTPAEGVIAGAGVVSARVCTGPCVAAPSLGAALGLPNMSRSVFMSISTTRCAFLGVAFALLKLSVVSVSTSLWSARKLEKELRRSFVGLGVAACTLLNVVKLWRRLGLLRLLSASSRAAPLEMRSSRLAAWREVRL